MYYSAQLRTDLISVKSSLKEKHHEGYLLCPLPLLSRQVMPVDVEGREYGLARPRSQVILLLHLLLLQKLPLGVEWALVKRIFELSVTHNLGRLQKHYR